MMESSKFVELARKSHLSIHCLVQQYLHSGFQTGDGGSTCLTIRKKLKKLKIADDHSAERLFEKIESSQWQLENVLENLKLAKGKIDTENERACALINRKAKKDKRVATTLLICGTLAGAMVGLPHMGAMAGLVTTHRVSKACSSRETKEQQRHERALEAHCFTEGETVLAIMELCSIKFLINKVINEIDSLLRTVEVAINHGEVDFAIKTTKNKMKGFGNQIEVLDSWILNLEYF